jgi:alginate production protein
MAIRCTLLLVLFLLLFLTAQSAVAGAVADLTSFIFDPDAWSFGSEIEFKYEPEHNFNLNSEVHHDESEFKFEYKPWIYFKPNDHFHIFSLFELYGKYKQYSAASRDNKINVPRLELKEAYAKAEDLAVPGGELSFKLGRQYFGDEHQWLYDAELDGLRLTYERHDWQLQLAAMRRQNPHLFHRQYHYRIDNLLARADYDFGPLDLAVYALKQYYLDHTSGKPLFVGLEINGDLADGDLEYWLEPGLVRGHDGDVALRGWGIDAGFSYTFDLPLEPTLTLDYAYGSGDSEHHDDVDHAYRQTGLTDTEEDFHGLIGFDYFGVMLEPELSNLKIRTVGLGFQITDLFSGTLFYHQYRQVIAQPYVRHTALHVYPDGHDPDLGSEIDWVMGFEPDDHLKAEFQLGYFMPGPAYEHARGDATFLKAELKYKF